MIDHIEHFEDLLFFSLALPISRSMIKLPRSVSCSVKYDGKPSVVFGTMYQDCADMTPRPFVGTKSVFNKVKKIVCYSQEDIDAYYGDKPDLAKRLSLLFKSIEKHSDKQMSYRTYQGDFLFIKDDLTQIEIDGKTAYEFTPNVVRYAVENANKYDAGLAIHGKTVNGTRSNVYQHDVPPGFWCPRMNVGFDTRETINFFSEVDLIHRDLGYSLFSPKLADFSVYLKLFVNHCVREKIADYDKTYDAFCSFVSDREKRDQLNAKTSACKIKKEQNRIDLLDRIRSLKTTIEDVFSAHTLIARLKNDYIKHLDMISKQSNVWTYGGHEGYVIKNDDCTNMFCFKLVNRNRFSLLNFEKYK